MHAVLFFLSPQEVGPAKHHKRGAGDGEGRRSAGGQQSRYFAPPWGPLEPVSSPMLCSCDSACKYLGGFARRRNRSPSVQPAAGEMSAKGLVTWVLDGIGMPGKRKDKDKKKKDAAFFLCAWEQHLCALGADFSRVSVGQRLYGPSQSPSPICNLYSSVQAAMFPPQTHRKQSDGR